MNTLDVHVDIGADTPHAGTAHFSRRVLTTTFQYRTDYLTDPRAYPIDPEIPLFAGQYAARGLPRAFSDCAPDRWGRNLITTRVRGEALAAGRTQPTVDDVDFVINVSDATRQGALRFCEPGGSFLSTDSNIPQLIELPALLAASDAVTRDDQDGLEAVKALLGAGTGTLGGARPKASVRDGGRLHIAKFPKPTDEWGRSSAS